MKDPKTVTDKELGEAIKHIDAACVILGMCFKELLLASDKQFVIGFMMGPKEMFDGDVEVEESNGLWMPALKPEDPKQLN